MVKRIFSVICIIAVILSMSTVVFAEEGTSVRFNDDKKDYSSVVVVENGKLYVPMRMIFPNTNDMENKTALVTMWEKGNIVIQHGATTGEDVVEQKIPFAGVRKSVEISYYGDPYEGVSASFIPLEYEGDPETAFESGKFEYGEMKYFTNPIIMKSVGTDKGYRFFISLEDANTIAEHLGLDESYSVKFK